MPNLSRTRERNSDYLTMLGRKSKGAITPKVCKIITLYHQGKISQVQTAENMIVKLVDSKTEKQQTTTFKPYDKLVEKYETKEPLSKRLSKKNKLK